MLLLPLNLVFDSFSSTIIVEIIIISAWNRCPPTNWLSRNGLGHYMKSYIKKMLSKFVSIIVMTKYSLSTETKYMQKCPRNRTMNNKVWIMWKQWAKFLSKAQKSSKVHFIGHIWWPVWESERSVLYLGELAYMLLLKSFPDFRLWYKMQSKQFSRYYWFMNTLRGLLSSQELEVVEVFKLVDVINMHKENVKHAPVVDFY